MNQEKGILVTILFTALLCMSFTLDSQPDGVERLWRNPPNDYRMKTWWFFGYEKTADEGITADAEAFSDAGFGGVVYYDQNHAKDALANGADEGFSNSWWRHLRFAAAEAKRNHLTFELNISNGYCAGGRWIDPAHAMQRVASAELIVSIDSGGHWHTESGDLSINGPENYVKDIAIIAMPYHDDGKMRHLTARYNASGKGRNGAMQGPLPVYGKSFTGYGFKSLPDIGTLQVSNDSIEWQDVVTLSPMYRSQGGYFVRTNAFPATEGRYWRINYASDAILKEWKVGSEAMFDRWEERAALHSDFSEGDVTPLYLEREVSQPKENIICLSPSDTIVSCPQTLLPQNSKIPKWRILRLASVLTGAKSKHGRQNLLGYECDKLSEEAARMHWDNYVQVLLDSLPPGSVSGITMDSHEGGSQNWTPRMLEEFRTRQGYELTPYLPVLAGYIVESVEKTSKVLYDFRKTIASLVQENYFGTFQRLASQRSLIFTAQAIGNALCITGDAISVKQAVEKPQGEFWTYQQQGAYDVKDCSSAAHLYGKPIASAEAMTDCEYKDTPESLHRVANIAFSMGAQEMVICASPHIPMKHVGQPYIAGRQYAINRSNPNWLQMKPVWLQAARSMVMLRQGKASPDVLIFLGDDVPVKTLTNRLPENIDHLDWDVCTGDALKYRVEVKNKKLVTHDGIEYQALLMADKAHVNEESQKLIDRFRSEGLPVLFSGISISSPIEIINGKGNIVHTHRKTDASEIYYLANIDNCNTYVTFRFSELPKNISVWHNLTGKIHKIKPNADGLFSLSLKPCESVFLTYPDSLK